MSTYGVMSSVGGSVGGMAMSRSSGMGRFASVPAIVAFVMLWHRACGAAIWAPLFAATCVLVYMMQSRGAIFSLAFALVVVSYVLGLRARLAAIAMMILAAVAIRRGNRAGGNDRAGGHPCDPRAVSPRTCRR